MAAQPTIDIWANWWPAPFFAAYPPMVALYERLGLQARTNIDAAAMLAEMDAASVNRVVLSATAFDGSPVHNAAVAAVVARLDGRAIGCASIDPRHGMAAVRELERAVRDDGMRALKLLPFLYDAPPDAASYFPLYAKCVELDIPALILTGHTAVLRPNANGHPSHLDAVALHFPELTIVAGHGGHPWTEELVALAWKHARLFIDTSGHRPRHWPPALVRYANSYGIGKVAFGTGYPLMDFATPLGELAALDLKPAARAALLHGAAATIFGGAL